MSLDTSHISLPCALATEAALACFHQQNHAACAKILMDVEVADQSICKHKVNGPVLVESLIALRRWDEAKLYQNKILENFIDPHGLNRMGVIQTEFRNFEAANFLFLKASDVARSMGLKFAAPHLNRAFAYQQQGKYPEAEQCFKQAIHEDYQHMESRAWLGMCQLTQGNYVEGLPNYEGRLLSYATLPMNGKKIWTGKSGVENLVVYHEQGVGDGIMCWQYIIDPSFRKAYGIKHISYVVAPEIASFFRMQQAPDTTILVAGEEQPDYTYHVAMMSLPGLRFKLGLPPLRATWMPYLKKIQLGFSPWPELESDGERPVRVGLCFKGNPAHKNDRLRSLTDKQAVALYQHAKKAYGTRNVQFVLLQREPYLADGFEGIIQPDTPDLGSLSVLVNMMDLVITVDTMVAHMAGGLGVPTVVMLPVNPDWRWGLQGGSPLYGIHHLLQRQREIGEWTDRDFEEITSNFALLESKITFTGEPFKL